MSKLSLAAVLAACLCSVPGVARSQEAAGHILWLVGKVERVGADGSVRTLAKGDAVYEGDVIRSSPSSSAQLIMRDEALIALRAESSVKLSKYCYGGHVDGAERAVIELIRGGMRSITGVIGSVHKENYQLKTDTHVIGIRGTDHETFATADGTYDRVTLGGTYLQGSGGRIDLAPGEVGFASKLAGSAPVRLERTPEFMQLALLSGGTAGPHVRGPSAGDELRLRQEASQFASSVSLGGAASALPALATPGLPTRALGETAFAGGRCDGSCADPLKNNGRRNR